MPKAERAARALGLPPGPVIIAKHSESRAYPSVSIVAEASSELPVTTMFSPPAVPEEKPTHKPLFVASSVFRALMD